jgi:intracellular multiplication protein IcmD
MKVIAVLLTAALTMSACSNANLTALPVTALAPLTLSAPVGSEYALDDGVPAGTSDVGPVLPLVAILAIATNYGPLNLLAWGTKNTSGNIQALQEIAVYDTGQASQAASLFFDPSGHLTSIVDEPTGYSIAFSSASTTQVTATLCDPIRSAVVHITVRPDIDENPQGQLVPGGTCAIANAFALAPAPPGVVAGPGPGAPTNLADFSSLLEFITEHSYVPGMLFAVGAIVQFKAHKDNPTQTPVGTPIMLLFLAVGLLFLPAIINTVAVASSGNEATALAADGIAPFVSPP